MIRKCLILANGSPPNKSILQYLRIKGYSLLICADGGANTAKKFNLIPDYIIGDLDSIKPDVYRYYSDKSRIIKIKRQNDTDVEKCLKYAIKKKYTEAVLLGAIGDRLDHSFCNLGILLKYFDRIKVKLVHQKSLLSVHSGNLRIETIPKEIISLYGFDEKTVITSTGLKYAMHKMSLPFGKKESTSNVAKGCVVNLRIAKGKIFIIRDLNTVVKNGLL